MASKKKKQVKNRLRLLKASENRTNLSPSVARERRFIKEAEKASFLRDLRSKGLRLKRIRSKGIYYIDLRPIRSRRTIKRFRTGSFEKVKSRFVYADKQGKFTNFYTESKVKAQPKIIDNRTVFFPSRSLNNKGVPANTKIVKQVIVTIKGYYKTGGSKTVVGYSDSFRSKEAFYYHSEQAYFRGVANIMEDGYQRKTDDEESFEALREADVSGFSKIEVVRVELREIIE